MTMGILEELWERNRENNDLHEYKGKKKTGTHEHHLWWQLRTTETQSRVLVCEADSVLYLITMIANHTGKLSETAMTASD